MKTYGFYKTKRSFYILILLFFIHFLINTKGFSQNYSEEKILISDIVLSGNIKTKKNTILRELTFASGDTVLKCSLENEFIKSKHNLLNKPLFNYVNINYSFNDSASVIVEINVEERWYLWPEAAIYYIDRNFSNWLEEKDWSRIDIGLGVVKYNFRGRNEKITLYTFFGYDEELLLKYENLYLDKKRRHALSFTTNLKRRKETSYGISDDKIKQIQLNDEYALRAMRSSVTYSFRKAVFNKHKVSLLFEGRSVSDSLLSLNSSYHFSETNTSRYILLSYNFVIDRRNYRTFPTEGHKIDLTISKYGLNIFPESNINSFKINADLSLYSPLSDRFSMNNNITLKKTLGDENPYYLNTAFGFLSSARGYEYYAVNGRDMVLSKNSLNFELLPKKIFHVKFIPWEKFNKIHFTVYASTFFDFVYVCNENVLYNSMNNFQNSWLYGYGLGLNFLTYYDKLLRIEYSFNKQNENGFYIHFEAPF